MIVYEDKDLIAVDKPPGLLAVPGRTEPDCLSARLQLTHPEALVVHRLDQATSGLMLFARHKAAQSALSAMFRDRLIHKQYVAVVHGVPPAAAGCIDLPLAADWPSRPRQKVDHTTGKPSLTHWQLLATAVDEQTARLALSPETGRTHQLRVHLMAIGHPIVGDTLYGPQNELENRLMLHAEVLNFAHPLSGQRLALRSPPAF